MSRLFPGRLNCASCGHVNREEAKFCAQCATQLPTACVSCGTELAPGHGSATSAARRSALLPIWLPAGRRRIGAPGDGRVPRHGPSVHHDEDDLESAPSELDRVWIDTLAPDDAETYRIAAAQYAAHVALDADGLDRLTAEDLVFVDRRTIDFGEFDRVGFFEVFETRRSTRGTGSTRVTAVNLLERGVLVSSTEEYTTADGDEGGVSGAGAFVTRVRDGRVDHAELFDGGQRDLALERSRELTES